MSQQLPITEIREKFAEITGRVQFAGERIAIQKHGKTVAALVPPSDLEALRTLEEQLDLLDALEALSDYRAEGGVSLEELKASLGPKAARRGNVYERLRQRLR
ncbi:MAG: type II toxin-antitoxin system Phd/YefM family antitoxin [Gammaproteobacteria bacterium]|nr:type II toxin-antitoxin system Phd/YefM family antitoxin [Gammaproteobacteria bacterium]